MMRQYIFSLRLLISLLVCCGSASAADAPQRFGGLGDYARPVSTSSAEAQAWMNQGMAFMYAFNHDEALRAFRAAAAADPDCAMCWWGIAVANGPHINNMTVDAAHNTEALEAIAHARTALAHASPVESALVEAVALRHADPPPADRAALDAAYAEAMDGVWRAFPRDADVGALYAESLANLRPWDLWSADGQPKEGTEKLVALLETVIALAPHHPLANHLYIHAVEASSTPGRADNAADTLRELQPGLGHMVHMPSHIDVRRGRWQQAVTANAKAIVADSEYARRSPEQNFYRLYMSHNYHMLTYAAMMTGQSELALKTIRDMVADIPPDFFRDNSFADGMMVMPMEVMMRFGKWDQILAEPTYPDYVPLSRALQHYARAVAHAARNEVEAAKGEQSLFVAARERVPDDIPFGNNNGAALLDVAQHLMAGEILYRDGEKEKGLAQLREAVAREDALRYDEPPGWIQPVRHPLGAALLQSGQLAEAEAVFRADLERLPGNGWGLYGLARALELQGKTEEAKATMMQFDTTWKNADIRIKSPCLCLPGV